MGLNSAGLTAVMDGGADALAYVGIGDGPLSSDQVSAGRAAISWSTATDGEIPAVGLPYQFTGPADGTASHMLFFSASTGGTFYGFQELDGDQAFNADGEFELVALALAAADPEVIEAPAAPFALGSEVGVPTGTTLTDRSSLGSPTSLGETFEITHPVTGETAEIECSVYRGIRFTNTITPSAASEGATILFENCSFEGAGNWCVEVDNTGGVPDVMQPLVIFSRCSFDGGSDGTTDKCMIGGYCWVIGCDMRGAEDGWSGWYYNVGMDSNFVAYGATIELHSDGVQCLDTGRSTFFHCWISAGVGPGASQAFRVGTEAGAAQDIDVRYCGLDRGGYAMQFRGDSGAGDIDNVHVQGCRWTREHEFGPIDVEQTTNMTWLDNAYFDGEVIPSPV